MFGNSGLITTFPATPPAGVVYLKNYAYTYISFYLPKEPVRLP